MAFEFVVDVDGADRVVMQMQAGIDALADLSPAFEAIIPDFQAEEQERFASQPWAPLSPGYAAWKARTYGNKGILRLTDRLMDSLTKETADAVIDVTPDSLTIGTRVPYAVKHHRGIDVPTRTLIEPSPDFQRRARAHLERFIDQQITRSS